MKPISGTYFDGRSSKAHRASLFCAGDHFTVDIEGGPSGRSVPVSKCRIDPPLGRTGRSIRFPWGGVFETSEEDAFAFFERFYGRNRLMRVVHFFETRWRTVGLALAGLVLFVWLFHSFAIPFLAEKIAFSLPNNITDGLSRQTLAALDKRLLLPSGLDPGKAAAIRKRFAFLLQGTGADGFAYRLEFRKSPEIGPNAFALPSGTIVMTDELVKLAKNERELDGVLLHEIGHVKKRHALRSLIQNAGFFLIVTALTGDLSWISSTAASLPTLLAHSGYSRDFEREADAFAAVSLVRMNLPIGPMKDILLRMSKKAHEYPGESLLSTHPVMQERLKAIDEKAAEEELKVRSKEKDVDRHS